MKIALVVSIHIVFLLNAMNLFSQGSTSFKNLCHQDVSIHVDVNAFYNFEGTFIGVDIVKVGSFSIDKNSILKLISESGDTLSLYTYDGGRAIKTDVGRSWFPHNFSYHLFFTYMLTEADIDYLKTNLIAEILLPFKESPFPMEVTNLRNWVLSKQIGKLEKIKLKNEKRKSS